jgi:hypothetical protein
MKLAQAIASTNEQTLDFITSVQDRITEASRSVASLYPSLPSLDELPALPWFVAVEPGAAREVVEETFEFRSKLLEANKDFAIGLLDAMTPKATTRSKTKAA